jgi:hypothetical protein
VLDHVLDSIRLAHQLGLWVEVVTLVVPGFNDSTEELMEAARYIKSVSGDIPWHVTAFHKDYKMTAPDNTSAQTLLRAADIGREAGLHYVYAGNIRGRVGEYENTFCPNCNHPNPPAFKFCGECGHNLSIPSETKPKELSFDEKLAKIQRYLPKDLTQKILAQRDKIEGERKQVTVMFCDMEGFTPLTEKLGPERNLQAYG